MAKWFYEDEEAIAAMQKHEEEQAQANKLDWRYEFKVEYGGEKKFIFLSNKLFYTGLHTVRKGKRSYIFVCLGDEGKCPFCAVGMSISWVLVLTVLNLHGQKIGNEVVRPIKQRFIAKSKVKSEILHMRSEQKDLKFTQWKARRGKTKNECATGEHFDYLGRVPMKKLKAFLTKLGVEKKEWKELLTPLDLEDIYAPLDLEEAKKQAKKFAPDDGPDEFDDSDFDDDDDKDIEDLASDPEEPEKESDGLDDDPDELGDDEALEL